MQNHIHTDIVSALWAAASVIAVFHAMRYTGAWLIANKHDTAGKFIGGLVTFS